MTQPAKDDLVERQNVTKLMRDLLTSKPDHWKQCFDRPEMIGWFVGQVAKETGGNADLDLVRLTFEFALRAEKAERELAEAREALKPFADLMDLVIGSAEENDFGVTATIQLTDLRRAARAYANKGELT